MESEVEVFVVKVWVGKKSEETASYPFPIPIFAPIPPSSMLVVFLLKPFLSRCSWCHFLLSQRFHCNPNFEEGGSGGHPEHFEFAFHQPSKS